MTTPPAAFILKTKERLCHHPVTSRNMELCFSPNLVSSEDLVPDATVALDVNTTVGESTVLPCTLITTDPVHLENLRFYWQDERHCVLYSFNKGNEMSSHVNELYRGRITAFPQHMIRGNISVQLGKPELQDDGRVFQVFAAVFDKGPRGYVEHKQICCHTLHVAVPYTSVDLAVNEETMTAVCNTHRGFPKPLVEWRLQYLSNNSQHFVDPRDVYTRAVQDRENHLYNISSRIDIPGGLYRSVICLFHNPTLNVAVNATHALNKGEAKRSLPGWAVGLMATVVLLFSTTQ
ncbi:CD276 antigen [Larimichthys crocea]|uniref:Uncharacterized protein n=1 Tax=Larimichthys crocea TaxID=215358 RepID=A0ACD3QH16_LARCR|nr:CD276 antigen [Larimichthys crocea]